MWAPRDKTGRAAFAAARGDEDEIACNLVTK